MRQPPSLADLGQTAGRLGQSELLARHRTPASVRMWFLCASATVRDLILICPLSLPFHTYISGRKTFSVGNPVQHVRIIQHLHTKRYCIVITSS
jgi:hypothetical protein